MVIVSRTNSHDSECNHFQAHPEDKEAIARNEKLMEELQSSSHLEQMSTALKDMKQFFPDVNVADEFKRFDEIKTYVG